MTDLRVAKTEDVQVLVKGAQRAGARDAAPSLDEPDLLSMLSLSDWRRFVPETLVLLALIAGVEFWLGRRLGGTGGVPHAYWLPVLLASAQYGVVAGMLASVATIGCYIAFGLPPQSAAQSFYDYASVVAAQPAAWLAAALVLGGLRSLHIHQHSEVQAKLSAAQRTAVDLADGLERATDEIEQLERSIAYENGGVASLIRSFSKLDLSDRASAISTFSDVVRFGVGAQTFMILLKHGDRYEAVAAIEDDVAVPAAALTSLDAATLEIALNRPGGVDTKALGIGQCDHCLVGRVAGQKPDTMIGVIICLRLDTTVDEERAQKRLTSLGLALHNILLAVDDRAEPDLPKGDNDGLPANADQVVLAKAAGAGS
ncbi:MAG: hypothetical protein KDJ47_09355 [Hyphomicrobiaceae bacterium]|nr:hypothetical protein [Hyphomicrobiaceae bacterium]